MQDLLILSEIDLYVIVLLLMLPVVATIIAISRHIIGLKSVGVFITILLTLAMYQMGLVGDSYISNPFEGLKYALSLLVIVLLVTTVAYGLVKSWALHYYPKVALVLTIIALAFIGLLMLGGIFDFSGFVSLNVFALLLMSSLAEKIMNLLSRKSFKVTSLIIIESTVVAAISYLIISWPDFQEIMLSYPFLIVLLIPANYLIGRFNGLRFREYLRFRDILDRDE